MRKTASVGPSTALVQIFGGGAAPAEPEGSPWRRVQLLYWPGAAAPAVVTCTSIAAIHARQGRPAAINPGAAS